MMQEHFITYILIWPLESKKHPASFPSYITGIEIQEKAGATQANK